MDLRLPGGLRARPMTPDDAPAVTALVAACEADLDGAAEIDLDDIAANFGRHGFDPATDSLVVLDGDEFVAWADAYRGRADVDVHPAYRGRGLGAALLEWSERRAAALGWPSVRRTVTDANTAAADLFTSHGYAAAYTSWILQASFDGGPPPPPAVPEGVTIRAYDGPRDERAVYRVVEDAFGEWAGREPTTFEEWVSLMVRHGSFAPDLSALAFDRDELVGVALSLDYASMDEGWIQQVATRATHRHRGIALALLLTVFGAFYERGKTKCGLSTDSRTGALSLYEKVGMRVRRSYTSYAKPLA